MSDNDYGLTPEQYHVGIDKLWKALENGERDVFTMCADRIKELESHLRAYNSLKYDGEFVAWRNKNDELLK